MLVEIFDKKLGNFLKISHTHTDPQFEGKGCGFQRGSKIVDLGFVEFKSNGTKTNKTLEQIQKTQGATK